MGTQLRRNLVGLVLCCVVYLVVQQVLFMGEYGRFRDRFEKSRDIGWASHLKQGQTRPQQQSFNIVNVTCEEFSRRDRPPPIGYQKVAGPEPQAAFLYDLGRCREAPERTMDESVKWTRNLFLEATQNKCAKRMDVHDFACEAGCPQVEPELERVFRVFNIAKYRLHGLLRLCKAQAFPFLVYIKDNQIRMYKCQTHATGKSAFKVVMHFLLMVSCVVDLPDIVFGFDGNDYAVPQTDSPLKFTSDGWIHPLPGVFRFVGSDSQVSALFPTPPFLRYMGFSITERMDAWPSISRKHKPLSWEERSDALFWRGGSTGIPFDYDFIRMMPRPALLERTHNQPGFDCGLTTTDGVSSKMKEQGFFDRVPMADFVRHKGFEKFKYHLHVDGNTASWGLAQKILIDALVVWQRSPATYREHYYDLLRPWEHYVPLSADMGNLLAIRDWLGTPDGKNEARAITDRLNALVQKRFQPQHTICYILKLLNSMANLQDFEPVQDLEPMLNDFRIKFSDFMLIRPNKPIIIT